MQIKRSAEALIDPTVSNRRLALIYARVSSKTRRKRAIRFRPNWNLLRGYAGAHGFQVLQEFGGRGDGEAGPPHRVQ